MARRVSSRRRENHLNPERFFASLFGDDEPTQLGSGWISGVFSVFAGALSVGAVLCLHYPALLTSPELRAVYPMPLIRRLIQAVIVLAFASGALSMLLRRRKILGLTGLALAALATLGGGSSVPLEGPVARSPYLGLDWFLLSLFATAFLFVPMERAWPLKREQTTFRPGWWTDTVYYFASHGLVQVLSFLILLPATVASRHLGIPAVARIVSTAPMPVQLVGVMILADLTQYWIHRAFHEIPLLWRFHQIHHSSRAIDWLAGSRLHLVDVVVTRGLVLVPVTLAGFSTNAIYAYLGFVSVHAVFIHANFAPSLRWIEPFFVVPRFHHWHHAAEAEAIDRDYAIHFPWIDRLFGSFHFPDRAWPKSYGLAEGDLPDGFFSQAVAPFRKSI